MKVIGITKGDCNFCDKTKQCLEVETDAHYFNVYICGNCLKKLQERYKEKHG